MSTLELDVGREGAERLVEAALRRTEGVDGFVREGDSFVVKFEGMTASYGQKLTITFEDRGDTARAGASDGGDANRTGASDGGEGRTAIDVQAYRTSPFAFTANPWRRKADFLEALRRIRDDPRERARIERGEFEADPGDEPAATEPEPVDPAELQTLRAVKLLLAVVGSLVLLVLVAAWVL